VRRCLCRFLSDFLVVLVVLVVFDSGIVDFEPLDFRESTDSIICCSIFSLSNGLSAVSLGVPDFISLFRLDATGLDPRLLPFDIDLSLAIWFDSFSADLKAVGIRTFDLRFLSLDFFSFRNDCF